MNTNNNNGLQGYGPPLPSPLQGYSDPNSNNYNNTNANNPINSSVLIPGTYVPNGNPNDVYQVYTLPGTIKGRPRQPMLCRVITGGNDGLLYVHPKNPSLAYNSKHVLGHICTECGKGLLFLDRNAQCLQCLVMICPCICCYLRYCKKRKCTSCKAELPNTWC
jgi:hypothetical protein